MNKNLFVDRKLYDKKTLLEAIIELDDFPALCPYGGSIYTLDEILDFQNWLEAFDSVGISKEHIAFGFDFDRPINVEDSNDTDQIPTPDLIYGENTSKEERLKMHKRWEEIYHLSTSNRKIMPATKIIFVRNKIPRTLLKSGLKPKLAFMLQDNPNWPVSTSTLDKLVESLPKRLYYMSQLPSGNVQSI
jgi:hypothetical protein